MQNQNVVQHNTNTTLQMWELWRSACECIILADAASMFYPPWKKQKKSHTFLVVCVRPVDGWERLGVG